MKIQSFEQLKHFLLSQSQIEQPTSFGSFKTDNAQDP